MTMISRILTHLAAVVLAVLTALLLVLAAAGSVDPDLHGVLGWLILLGVPALLVALAWVFAPTRRP